MIVYAELLVVQNFLVNFFLLYLSVKIFRINFLWWRLVLAAFFGVALAFAFVFISVPPYVDIILRAASGFVCVLLLVDTRRWQQIFGVYAAFLALTFSFGGLVYAVLNACKIDAGKSNLYSFVFSSTFILLVPFAIVAFKFARRINAHKKVSGFCYDAKIKFNGDTIVTRGFYDSGNRLKDKQTGKPINIISLSLAVRLCGNDLQSAGGGYYVPFATVGGKEGKMFVFEVTQIELKTEGGTVAIDNALCGVMLKNFSDKVQYEMLLNSEVLV